MAFVGCGGIARAHWRGIQKHAPRIDVTAVVDTNLEQVAAMSEQTGAPGFASLTQALAEGDFDAVDIMLPHDLHEPATLESFAAGKHVCLEKPMAHNLESCERILAAAAQTDTVFMIAEQAQYWTDVQKVRELIDAGAIGEVITARACFYDPQNVPPAPSPGGSSWPAPAAASPSTAAPIGSVHCA